MKVIAMGYNGTGSSAIVHLLKEFENCHDIETKNYEHNILYAPHGLFDLEDILLKNNSMYKCDTALDDFYSAMKNLNNNDYGWFGGFRKRYGNHFMKIVENFMDELIIYKRNGGWTEDNKFEFSIIYFLKDMLKYALNKRIDKFGYRINTQGDNLVKFAFPTEREFYSAGRKFINEYFSMIGCNSSNLYVFDQILEPQQLYRICNYFDNDVRFIVVDRDPRDMFISSKYIWSKGRNYSILPTDVVTFVNFYSKFLQTEIKIKDKRILRIHFEDLIYNYDKKLNEIKLFIGSELLGKHTYKKLFFDPEISIKNTQVYNSRAEWKSEVKYIENSSLRELMYQFPFEIHTNEKEFSDPNPDTSIKLK